MIDKTLVIQSNNGFIRHLKLIEIIIPQCINAASTVRLLL